MKMKTKWIKSYNFFKLNELFIHNDNTKLNDKWVLMFKKDVWIFDEDEWENLINDIKEKTGITDEDIVEDYFDPYELILEHPHILVGEIKNNILYIYSIHTDFRHGSFSTDLKKLKEELNLPVKVVFRRGKWEDDIEEMDINFKDKKVYHGTCLKKLNRISKVGLIPNKDTNFDKIKHTDKIFLTTNIEKAMFYAKTCSIVNNSFPIILEVKIPDKSKIVWDYDLVMDLEGEDSKLAKKLGYDIVRKKATQGNKYEFKKTGNPAYLSKKDRENLHLKLGTFGYKGRIPSSKIKNILFDSITYKEWFFYLEEEIGDINRDSDLWDELNDIVVWDELNFKELFNYIEDVREEFYNDFYEDEE